MENNEAKECKYLGEYSGDCWLCSGNIFQECMYHNKKKCLLIKNEQRKERINELEQQNEQLTQKLEKAREDFNNIMIIASDTNTYYIAQQALKELE